jgi:transposase
VEDEKVILMETTIKIRRLVLRDGHSIRSVSKTTGLSRNTIRKYLKDSSVPHYHREQATVRYKLRDFEEALRLYYEQDLKRPRRERRTALKLYEQLVTEGYTGSYSPVCRFIKDLKSDSSKLTGAFIPLLFQSGDALQFDWSEEHVVLGSNDVKIKVAHFRLCHSRKPFIVAYPNEVQEMVLDAFVQALSFYGGVPRRVIIDNPKTMVTYVSRSKDRIFHPRFLALMNHYVIEPVACTPASGWEKGQVEKQVQDLRRGLFVPKLSFDDLESLNDGLLLRCNELGSKAHPEKQDQTIDEIFADEKSDLMPLGAPFDGYVEKRVRVRSTCLVQYDCNRYSVPARYAGQHISLRAYARRIVLVMAGKVIAEHKHHFTKNMSYFEPWHYVPILLRKPGTLRDGAPFIDWQLASSMHKIKVHYMNTKGGDRDFVELLMQVQEHGIEIIETACDLAVEQNTLRLPAIINLMNRLIEPIVDPLPDDQLYPKLTVIPQADCKRYEMLYRAQEIRV